MTMKDKLEIGLKEDAPFRRDNLPEQEKSPGGSPTRPDDPTRSPVDPAARAKARARKRAAQSRKPRPKPCKVE